MTHRVRVFNSVTEIREPWWDKFIVAHGGFGEDDGKLNQILEIHNAVDDLPDENGNESDYIIFDSENDYLMFVLKWS